jgi:hypothetical protein
MILAEAKRLSFHAQLTRAATSEANTETYTACIGLHLYWANG